MFYIFEDFVKSFEQGNKASTRVTRHLQTMTSQEHGRPAEAEPADTILKQKLISVVDRR